jgi:hypothetical protein
MACPKFVILLPVSSPPAIVLPSLLAFIAPPGPSKSQEQIYPVECVSLFNWGLTPLVIEGCFRPFEAIVRPRLML